MLLFKIKRLLICVTLCTDHVSDLYQMGIWNENEGDNSLSVCNFDVYCEGNVFPSIGFTMIQTNS